MVGVGGIKQKREREEKGEEGEEERWVGIATTNASPSCKVFLFSPPLLPSPLLTLSLHTSFDDIEDYTELRRGQPVAHRVFGLPHTINTAAYAMFVAMSKLYTITGLTPSVHQTLMDIFLEEILELHRGQGLEIYWRETGTCPSEDEYFCMIKQKTGGLFRLGVRLMAACSSSSVTIDCTSVVDLFSVFFQVRDDVMNLDSSDYAAAKGFAEDLTEGKFSFPVVHAVGASDEAGRTYIIDTLRTHPTDPEIKLALIKHLTDKTKSLEYSRALLRDLDAKMTQEVERLGGNEGLKMIMGKLRY
ncbi:hypothetical protein NMY22_g19565 [Coprinellus aureogranulatus]|nr:hypothetical protein NMY22_g19565 [Coprinellus aureogranulatus]